MTLGTDPTINDGDRVFDNDGDGLSNFDETSGRSISWRLVSTQPRSEGVLVACTPQDDGIPECDGANEPTSDPSDPDTDDDGLNDGQERDLGTHPRRADTDGDGRRDRSEANGVTGTCNGEQIGAETDPVDADQDDDLLSDGEEIGAWSDNSWIVRVVNAVPYSACPDPTQQDADLDQLVDGEERALVNDANEPAPTDPNLFDTDEDGVSDGREAASDRPTDPLREDQWVEFRYTQIDTLGSCDGGQAQGEFHGRLSLQEGGVRHDLFELTGASGFAPLQTGDAVEVNQFRRFVMRPGSTVLATSREFWECDQLTCQVQSGSDDDLTEITTENVFAYPVEGDTRVYAHACQAPGLQTTLVVTELD